jgi:eukaryotic-like serine/threonine-protein kinase
MLTTEKLFRGDTEFALMEKVRKAEVPPPSNFNRRVTPELDAISLKALARDVADRYQNAAQLAADLDALIAGYRFDPKELRQFMRQLFRKEYAKELEETETALEAQPGYGFGTPRAATPTGQYDVGTQTVPGVRTPPRGIQVPSDHEEMLTPPQITQSPQPAEEEPPRGTDPKQSGGFWGSLFRRKK